jgi:hypothetical protein
MKIKALTSDTAQGAADGLNSFLAEQDIIPYSVSLTFVPGVNGPARYLAALNYELAHNFRKGSVRLDELIDAADLEPPALEKKLRSVMRPTPGNEIICHDVFTTHQDKLMVLVLELRKP